MPATTDWLKNRHVSFSADALLFYACTAAFFSMPIGNAPMTAFAVLAFGIWLFSGIGIRAIRRYPRHSWFWPVVILILLPWLGLLYSADTTGLGLKYAQKTHYWLYALSAAGIAYGRYPAEHLIRSFMAGLAVVSLVAAVLILYLLATRQPIPNDLGIGPGYSTMSAYLVLGLLLGSFYFGRLTDPKQRWLMGLLLALYFFHLIMLRGRNGYFTFVVLSPLLVYNLFKKINLMKVLAIYAVLVAVAFASPAVRFKVVFTVEQIESHLQAPRDQAWGKSYLATEERFWIYVNAIQVFLEHPIAGVGTGGFQTAVQNRGQPDWPLLKHPHSSILQMAVSYGIIGVLVLLWMFWEMIKNSWSHRGHILGYYVFSTALVIFVSGLLNSQILNAGTAFLFAVTAGLQEGLPQFHRPKNDGPQANDANEVLKDTHESKHPPVA